MTMASFSLRRSQQDPRAFGDFYREHATAMARYFARRVSDPEAALDLTAETFAQAYAGRRRFRGATEQEARAWLYMIAQRQLAAYLRQGYADDDARKRLGLERPGASREELERVEELGAIGELRERLARQLEHLPEGYREAVRLRVVEELAYPEVAQRLRITEPAARMPVSRALAQLRSQLTLELAMENKA
jgi:RNA polymerase sigma-70 factor (ECF subfamily)